MTETNKRTPVTPETIWDSDTPVADRRTRDVWSCTELVSVLLPPTFVSASGPDKVGHKSGKGGTRRQRVETYTPFYGVGIRPESTRRPKDDPVPFPGLWTSRPSYSRPSSRREGGRTPDGGGETEED